MKRWFFKYFNSIKYTYYVHISFRVLSEVTLNESVAKLLSEKNLMI